jgi:tRNA isopentenyl-2-thiomethyl-A-37 hydroxylase MiaE
MNRRDIIEASAYGAAFANAMQLHGQERSEPKDGVIVTSLIDARQEADRWARMVASAAVERSERT